MFGRRGFEGTSLRAIAKAVGIRSPSLLYHFRNKEALRLAVLGSVLDHWKEELPRLLYSRGKGDVFDGLLAAVVGFFSEDPSKALLVVREMIDRPVAVKQMLAEHLRPWTTLLADAIRLGQERGTVRAEVDPEAYVVQVVTMALGTVAVGDVTAAMVDMNESEATDRSVREMARVGRTALYAA